MGKSGGLQRTISAVMAATLNMGDPLFPRQVADLKGIRSRNQHRKAALFQLLQDRFKERDVRRIVKIYPDLRLLLPANRQLEWGSKGSEILRQWVPKRIAISLAGIFQKPGVKIGAGKVPR